MFAFDDLDAEQSSQVADWRNDARCADGSGSLVALFFSEQLDDINRAKEFCSECVVREACLGAALDRHEPWGVWGGELLVNGRIVAHKRPRGRPRKLAPGEIDPALAPPPPLHPRDIPIARSA